MTRRLHIITRLEQRVLRTQNPRAPWSADARRAGETLEKGVEVDFKLGFCSSLRNHILRLNNKKKCMERIKMCGASVSVS